MKAEHDKERNANRENGRDADENINGVSSAHELIELGLIVPGRLGKKALVFVRRVRRRLRDFPNGRGARLFNARNLRAHGLAHARAQAPHVLVYVAHRAFEFLRCLVLRVAHRS